MLSLLSSLHIFLIFKCVGLNWSFNESDLTWSRLCFFNTTITGWKLLFVFYTSHSALHCFQTGHLELNREKPAYLSWYLPFQKCWLVHDELFPFWWDMMGPCGLRTWSFPSHPVWSLSCLHVNISLSCTYFRVHAVFRVHALFSTLLQCFGLHLTGFWSYKLESVPFTLLTVSYLPCLHSQEVETRALGFPRVMVVLMKALALQSDLSVEAAPTLMQASPRCVKAPDIISRGLRALQTQSFEGCNPDPGESIVCLLGRKTWLEFGFGGQPWFRC